MVLASALAAAALISCAREPTSPQNATREFQFSFVPEFPPAYQASGAGDVAPVERVRVILRRALDASLVLDTIVTLPASAAAAASAAMTANVSTGPLTLKAFIPSNVPTGDLLRLELQYLNSLAQILFQGGPVNFQLPPPGTGTSLPPPVQVNMPVQYSGPGATATRVVISPKTLSVVAGDPVHFTAQAFDAAGAVIATAPVVFTSADPTILQIGATGNGTAQPKRGSTTVTASLLSPTPATDAATVTVAPRPTTLTLVSGSGQTGVTGSTLAQPVTVRVSASDGPVSGVTVNFAAGSGGSAGSASAITDATGQASSTWRLGPAAGSQSMTVSSPAIAGSSVTATATATASVATRLVVTAQPSNAAVGAPVSVSFTAQDAAGSVATTFTGAVSVTLGGGAGGATLGGVTTVNAVAGVATFTGLTVSRSGTGFTLTGSSGGLSPATSNPFDVSTGAAARLAATAEPSGGTSGVVLNGQPVVEVQDASGARVTTASTAVTASVQSVLNGTGTLAGTTTVNAVNGVAAFTDLRFNGTGTVTLAYSAAGLTGATSSPFVVGASGPPLRSNPGLAGFTALRGGANPASIPVALTSAGAQLTGLIIRGITYDATATGWLSAGLGGATTPATMTLNAVTGALAVGVHTAIVTIGTSQGDASYFVSFTIQPLPPTQLVIISQPTTAISGRAMGAIAVELRDMNNGRVDGAVNSVTASIASGTGAIGGIVTVGAVNGTATFSSLQINGIGAHTIQFSSGALTPATSATITVSQAVASIAITTQPAGAVSGNALTTQPVVEIRDDAGLRHVTATNAVTASIVSGSGALIGTATVSAVAGVATFTNLQVNGFGAHTLQFAVGGVAPVSSNPFTVTQVATALAMRTQPSGAVNGIAFTTQPVVEVRDAAGLVVQGNTAAVAAAVASGTGVLGGTATANAVNGVATFSNLMITGTGAHTLQMTSGGLTPVTTAGVNVSVGPPTQLAITTQPAGAVSGVDMTTQPVVEVRDVSGNLTSSSASVTAAMFSGNGVLVGTATVAAVNGVATFTNLRVNGSGAQTIRFTSGALTAATSASFTVTQVAKALVMQTQPVGAASAVPLPTQPVVKVVDDAGLTVVGATNSVTASLASGAGSLAGTVTVAAVNGVVTFTNLTVTGCGAFTLGFASAGLTSATSASFGQCAGIPTFLTFSGTPTLSSVSGVPFVSQPVIQIRDGLGALVTSSTLAVTAAITSGTGTLVGTTTVNAVGGVATFSNLQINGFGAHDLAFTAGALAPATWLNFTVTQTVASLAITTQPSAAAASGAAFVQQPVITVRDLAGIAVQGNTALITAAKASGPATLAGTLGVNAVNGVATFGNLMFSGLGVGAHTIVFSTGGLSSVTSGTVTVSAGAAAQLAITTQPAGAVSGVALTTQPVVQVRDAGGNLTTSTANVTVGIASGTGAFGGAAPLTVAAVAGVATFAGIRVDGSGAHTFQFTSGGLTPATSSSFTVTQVAASLTVFTQPSAAATSGIAFAAQPVIRILDNAGILVTTGSGATLNVTASKATGTGTLSGTLGVAAVGGVATFTNLSIGGAGAHTLQFATTGPSLTVTSGTVTVTQVPKALVMQTQPVGTNTAVPLATQPVVRVVDDAGLVVAGATNSVTASLASGTGSLAGTVTIAAVNGVATFTDLVVTGCGGFTLGFASGGLTSTTSAGFGQCGGIASVLAITTQPAGAVSGATFTTQPVVQVRDGLGALVPGSTAPITAAITSGTGALLGTTTVNAVGGVATFTNLKINGSGAHTLTFTSAGLTLIASNSFTVTQTVASLAITTQPSAGAVTTVAFGQQPVLEIRDLAGLPVQGNTASVTAAKATGTGTLGGTLSVNAVNGVVTFTDLAITGLGAHTLTFSTGGLGPVTSTTITVAAGPATQLVITTQPAGSVSGVAFTTQPVVQIRDAGGNLTGSTANVTVAIASGTGAFGGAASLTVAAVGGVATFAGLRLDGSGAHTLQFTSGGLTPATSSSFTVTQNAASLSVFTQPSAAATSGVAFGTQPVIRILDNAGLVVTTGSGATLNVVASKATGTGTLGGTMTIAAVAGVATFTNLQLAGSGAHTLQFATTAPSLTITSGTVTVTQVPASLSIFTQPSASPTSAVPFATQPVIRILDNAGLLATTGVGATLQVTASVASGPGALGGTNPVTAVGGVATFTNLAITGAGAHTLQFATTTPLTVVSNTITVAAGGVGSVTVNLGSGSLNGNATTTATAVVRDGGGTIIPGAPVTWTASNGQVARVAQDGTVQALGAGASNIVATSSGVPGSAPLTVTAATAQFNITLRYITPPSAGVQAAFTAAVNRWQTIIRGDLPDLPLSNVDISPCASWLAGVSLTETVDDVIIYANVGPIDGVGGILGSAGPCGVRGGGLTWLGTMQFDDADLATMEANGTLTSVIMHEMGHVLGIGTLWTSKGLLLNPAPSSPDPAGDPTFSGVNGIWAFAQTGMPVYGGTPVPVENCCGAGTRNGHWREAVLARELMTGFISAPGQPNPLSPLTVTSLIDLGYVVDNSQADAVPWFTITGRPGARIEIREGPATPIFQLDARGRLVPLPPPDPKRKQ